MNHAIFTAPNATLIGDIHLEEETSVWFGCVLRAEHEAIHIGRGTNIQDLTMVHVDPGYPVVIGEEVIIGHRCIIHGCQIGDHTLVGMGAIIMNGARVGNYCIIGAGALITEGMNIPDYSVVMGVPGKVVNTVNEIQKEKIRKNAASYISLATTYRNQGLSR